jgi:hypothetical protein
MGNFDSKEVMNPLGRCGHDCSRYCLDECDCDWQCGCIKLKIQTHHTSSADNSENEENLNEPTQGP